ncbi:unnamed protein product [Onchocerca ochengi]|uniref:C2H2-type domain-containing protein n=2 Tax=Onchocerca TaxID=6281 RepID=A0A182E9X8_ONCOC|nr:unnamed protein product [Onchocerca ochengi]
MEKERKNNLRRQVSENHKWVAPPRTLVNLTESKNDDDLPRTAPVSPDMLYSETVVKAKKRHLTDSPTSLDTIALGHMKTIDFLASSIACRHHFYGYGESYNFGNDQQLSCAICHSKVGDRFPFQCTRCEFAAYRIPDVVCHTKEIHGNVDANLFVPTVPLGILQFYFNKVTECFPPMNYI